MQRSTAAVLVSASGSLVQGFDTMPQPERTDFVDSWTERSATRATILKDFQARKGSLPKRETPQLADQIAGFQPQALPVHPWSKPHGRLRSRLRGAQILSGRLAGLAVCNDVEGDLLPFVEGA